MANFFEELFRPRSEPAPDSLDRLSCEQYREKLRAAETNILVARAALYAKDIAAHIDSGSCRDELKYNAKCSIDHLIEDLSALSGSQTRSPHEGRSIDGCLAACIIIRRLDYLVYLSEVASRERDSTLDGLTVDLYKQSLQMLSLHLMMLFEIPEFQNRAPPVSNSCELE